MENEQVIATCKWVCSECGEPLTEISSSEPPQLKLPSGQGLDCQNPQCSKRVEELFGQVFATPRNTELV
jgi:hypothetical protein